MPGQADELRDRVDHAERVAGRRSHEQRRSFPERFWPKIEVHFDGIDTDFYRPRRSNLVLQGHALGPETRVDVALTIGRDAWLEWLPQETILFDRARLTRRTTAEIELGGRLLASEMIVLGRTAPSLLPETGVPQPWWSVLTNGSERPDGLAPWPSFSRPRPCAKELICKSNDLQIARVL